MRSVDRLSILLDMAKVLRVEVDALTGRPWQYAPNGGSTPADLDAVRRYFARYDHLLGLDPETHADLNEVRASASDAHKTYQAARYEQVIGALPDLLFSADALHRARNGRDRRELLLAYVSAYVVAAKLLTKMALRILRARRGSVCNGRRGG